MAVDKLVDSTQLDADLTSVANAIRIKGGTSAQMAFPAGFVSAVQAIPTGITPTGTKQISITANGTTTEDVAAYANAEITVDVSGGGGGYSVDDIASGGIAGSITVETSGTNVVAFAFAYNTGLTEVIMPNATQLKGGVFVGCTGLTRLWIPSVSSIAQGSTRNFQDITCPLVLLGISELSSRRIENWKGTVLDIGSRCSSLEGLSLYSVPNCNVIILRKSSIVTCANNTFNGSKFASGGAGGTIYIPKSLYDHLGDGTALDYKAATNWSTWDGYGTITWAQIEGSIYETQFADGTPIT